MHGRKATHRTGRKLISSSIVRGPVDISYVLVKSKTFSSCRKFDCVLYVVFFYILSSVKCSCTAARLLFALDCFPFNIDFLREKFMVIHCQLFGTTVLFGWTAWPSFLVRKKCSSYPTQHSFLQVRIIWWNANGAFPWGASWRQIWMMLSKHGWSLVRGTPRGTFLS